MSLTLTLTVVEAEALRTLLDEEQMRMDDDGCEGAFDATGLKTIAQRLRAAMRACR